jgi:sensor c-di-GMP phosphodiesterase-like protein
LKSPERGFIDVPKTTPVIQAFRQAGYEVAIDDLVQVIPTCTTSIH